MGPALIGGSVGQINLLIATLLGSFLAGGAISWLYYADRLMELPVGVLGAALGTVTLPRLARLHWAQDPGAFSQTLDWGMRWLLIAGLPAAVGLAVLAGPIVGTLFYSGAGEGGRFGEGDARMTAAALAAYSAGLPGFLGIKVLAPGYYARQRMGAPTRMALAAMLASAALGVALMGPLGHVGLALATAAAALLNAGLLLAGLVREGVYRPGPGWGALLARGLAANLAMALALHWGAGDLDAWLALGDGARAARLALWIGAGAGVYCAVLLAGGLRPRHLPGMHPGAEGSVL
jgi:putative peptidoglycan lipid II flippase